MILSGSAVHVKGFGSALDNGAAVRSCQRQTQVFDLPVRRMISLVPTPSALERMIAARQACFCEALRSLVITSSRPRTDRVIVMEIPVRMRQTRTATETEMLWGSGEDVVSTGADVN